MRPESCPATVKTQKIGDGSLKARQKVREIYLKFVEEGLLVRIDGNKPKKAVTAELLTELHGFLREIS